MSTQDVILKFYIHASDIKNKKVCVNKMFGVDDP